MLYRPGLNFTTRDQKLFDWSILTPHIGSFSMRFSMTHGYYRNCFCVSFYSSFHTQGYETLALMHTMKNLFDGFNLFVLIYLLDEMIQSLVTFSNVSSTDPGERAAESRLMCRVRKVMTC